MFFFVDSFVFGDGVADRETLPYKVGLKTGGRFRIVNFGYSGYGAEHMLAIVERGEVALRPPCQPTNIVYVALPDHVYRAAGKNDYSVRGPRYRLSVGVPVHHIDEILPGYSSEPMRYSLHHADAHPNPTAHDLVASYLAKNVVRPPD
jgi:hypothetical protein